jgi:hypothetical protein
MTDSPLHAALRAGADGLYTLEASTGLVLGALTAVADRAQRT